MAAAAAPLILLRSESYRMKTEQASCLMPTPSHNAMRPNARRPSVVQACATVTFVADVLDDLITRDDATDSPPPCPVKCIYRMI